MKTNVKDTLINELLQGVRGGWGGTPRMVSVKGNNEVNHVQNGQIISYVKQANIENRVAA